jgi:hypothetical protein
VFPNALVHVNAPGDFGVHLRQGEGRDQPIPDVLGKANQFLIQEIVNAERQVCLIVGIISISIVHKTT